MNPKLPKVAIVRRIKAAPEKVWAAITQPELMMQWWGPDAGPTLKVVADVRPGGRFSVVFRLLNGEEHNPTGLYREGVPEEGCARRVGSAHDAVYPFHLLGPYGRIRPHLSSAFKRRSVSGADHDRRHPSEGPPHCGIRP